MFLFFVCDGEKDRTIETSSQRRFCRINSVQGREETLCLNLGYLESELYNMMTQTKKE